jgi:pimeloyl-ACP methyl ester carboxylesterase
VHRYIAEFGCKQLPHGAWVHKIDRRTYAQRQRIDTLPLYAKITCPVLFLWAAHSRVSAGMIQQLREACPHAEIAPRRRFRTPPDPRPTGADDPPRAGVFTAP